MADGHAQQRGISETAPENGSDQQQPQPQPRKTTQQSQSRRAQVRSAQIRHRQRKAHHQKQLELEASEYRGLVAQIGPESAALRRENDAMRATLSSAGVDIPQWLLPRHGGQRLTAEEQAQVGMQSMRIDPYTSSSLMPPQSLGLDSAAVATPPNIFGDIDINDIKVTLRVDEIMGTPSLHISSSSSGNNSLHSRDFSQSPSNDDGWWLSQAQEDAAINFILSLEHVCWDHFIQGDFPHHYHRHGQDLPLPPPDKEPPHGHALMASTYVMADAPDSLYTERIPRLGSTAQNPATPKALPPPDPAASFEWSSRGISLASLRSLASSLNPAIGAEVTPVQAWFELAERYPPATLLEGGVLERLKQELRGVVRCVAYGAVIERGAFESIVGRVVHEFTPGGS